MSRGKLFEAKPNDVFEKYLFYRFKGYFWITKVRKQIHYQLSATRIRLYLYPINEWFIFLSKNNHCYESSLFFKILFSISFKAYQKHVYPPYAVVISSSIGRRPFQLFEKIAAGSLFWRWYVRLFLPLLSCSQSSTIYMKLFSIK